MQIKFNIYTPSLNSKELYISDILIVLNLVFTDSDVKLDFLTRTVSQITRIPPSVLHCK